MNLIIGLGNPGDKYRRTRHNVGFLVIDKIAQMNKIDVTKVFGKSIVGTGNIDGKKIVLAKPQTYMNLSGFSVCELMNWYKADISNLIVIYDDIDLSVGTIRIRPSGGAGTHNGMRSIIASLSTQAFPRIRVGIGSAPERMDLADYVLSTFSRDEASLIDAATDKAAESAMLIISKGVQEAMNKCNG